MKRNLDSTMLDAMYRAAHTLLDAAQEAETDGSLRGYLEHARETLAQAVQDYQIRQQEARDKALNGADEPPPF